MPQPTATQGHLRASHLAEAPARRTVMNVDRHVSLTGEPAVDTDPFASRVDVAFADELDRPVAARRQAKTPARLAGTVYLTRNKTSRATERTLTAGPTAAKLSAILVGEHLTYALLVSGMPCSLAAQAEAIARVIDPITTTYAHLGLDRRGPMFAEAAARYYLTWAQPAGLELIRTGQLRRWHDDEAAAAAEGTSTAGLDDEAPTGAADAPPPAWAAARVTALLARPRLIWTPPDGPAAGLLLDRFHHTPRGGVIERDTWTRRKVAEDLLRATALLRRTGTTGRASEGPRLLGVRVMSHLAPNAGIHFVPEFARGEDGRALPPVIGGHHRIGGCDVCTTKTTLPNSDPCLDGRSLGPAPAFIGAAS